MTIANVTVAIVTARQFRRTNLPGAIAERVRTRLERLAGQVVIDVANQRLDRCVAPRRILVHRRETQHVEVGPLRLARRLHRELPIGSAGVLRATADGRSGSSSTIDRAPPRSASGRRGRTAAGRPAARTARRLTNTRRCGCRAGRRVTCSGAAYAGVISRRPVRVWSRLETLELLRDAEVEQLHRRRPP